MDNNTKLIWLDLEMSGIEVDISTILQVAIIVTDSNLNYFDEGLNLVIKHPVEVFDNMDSWNKFHHKKSGLITKSLNSSISLEEAEQACIDYTLKYTEKKASPLCGNTIVQDRLFLHRYMPKFYNCAHYRSIDISSLKIIKEINFQNIPPFKKKNQHNSLTDIKESIEELKYYKKYLMIN